ncbi:hypothetical protein BMW26_07840 [Microbacterium sp. 1.5R]|nr:hypothetical protein BMW26_07840 [Microbacterium sp. 1.5R]
MEAFLKAECPSNWRVANVETLGSKTSGVVLSYEQMDVSAKTDDQELPEGWVWVAFMLILSTPETDAVKGLRHATEELSTLLLILDASPDLKWGPDATRLRFEAGESGYSIPIAFLATNTPPTPEPDPEPDAPEEE